MRQVLADLPVALPGLEALEGIDEPAETGATFAENARQKALYYARATGLWCLADDSGLVVDALGGEPGVHSARYAAERFGPDADRRRRDAANTAKLLEALENVPDDRRTARFVCHLALAEPGRVLLETTAAVEGVITVAPMGENGFGYDPVFLVPRFGRTIAQMPADLKNSLSHRGQAARQFAELLARMLGEHGKDGTGDQ
jgi:XTP/dITP diphosphohydrolase